MGARLDNDEMSATAAGALDGVAQTHQRPAQRHARRVRTRQAFDQSDLPEVVPELGTTHDQPSVTSPQMPQAVQIALPVLIIDQLLMLGRRCVAEHDVLSGRGGVPTPRGAPQLVPDPVLDGPPQAEPHRTGLFRLEMVEPRELLPQRVLDQVVRVDGPAHPLRQPTARPTP